MLTFHGSQASALSRDEEFGEIPLDGCLPIAGLLLAQDGAAEAAEKAPQLAPDDATSIDKLCWAYRALCSKRLEAVT